jgi:hypothetical protein
MKPAVARTHLQGQTEHVAKRGWQSHWHRHPGVRSGNELTRGERAADRMRNITSSSRCRPACKPPPCLAGTPSSVHFLC